MDNNLTQADGMYAIDQFYHQSTSLVFAKKGLSILIWFDDNNNTKNTNKT